MRDIYPSGGEIDHMGYVCALQGAWTSGHGHTKRRCRDGFRAWMDGDGFILALLGHPVSELGVSRTVALHKSS